MIHCSGGAQTKILHFIDNLHIIKDNLFDTPLFNIIKQELILIGKKCIYLTWAIEWNFM